MKRLRMKISKIHADMFQNMVKEFGFNNKRSELITMLIYLEHIHPLEDFNVMHYDNKDIIEYDFYIHERFIRMFKNHYNSKNMLKTQYFINLMYNYKNSEHFKNL